VTTARYLLDQSAGARMSVPVVRARLAPLMQRGLLLRCGIADLEVGVSARSREDHAALGRWRADALDYLSTPDSAWDRAWQVQEALADTGLHRAVKIPDLVIAAVAEHHRVSVMHYDRDFDRIAEVTGQPAEWVVPAGSLP
jgi:predicted nucleic acid-binding protein